MLEKYEKPEIIMQKMEINVLRATCGNKENLTEGSVYDATPGDCSVEIGCGVNCSTAGQGNHS